MENFNHNYTPLREDVKQAIKLIYEDLSKYELLEGCLGGFSQIANGSLNQLIWRVAPKKLSGSGKMVEFASYVAACTFKERAGSFLTILSDMNVSVGPSALIGGRLSHQQDRDSFQTWYTVSTYKIPPPNVQFSNFFLH